MKLIIVWVRNNLLRLATERKAQEQFHFVTNVFLQAYSFYLKLAIIFRCVSLYIYRIEKCFK
jgi:hypothetical protein